MRLFCLETKNTLIHLIADYQGWQKVMVFAENEDDARFLMSIEDEIYNEIWLDHELITCKEIPIIRGIVDF